MHLKRIAWFLMISAGLLALAGCGGDSSGPSGDDPTGSGTVVVDPEPDAIDAPWSLDGPGGSDETGNGDATFADMPAGTYRLTWGDVAGWTAPGQETRTLADGQTLTFTGNYFEGQIDPGSVTVDPNPDEINAPWTLTYPGRFIYTGNGDSTMTSLPAGPYRITWGDVPGWATPPEVIETMEEGAGLVVSATYVELGQIHIDMDPDGIEGSWALEGPDRYILEGRGDSAITDLPAGPYTVTWGAAIDYDTPSAQQQTLAEGGSLTFTGSYTEIAYPTGYVLVNQGTFIMGSPLEELGSIYHERPQHAVTLTNSFDLGKTEVTNGQYKEMLQWAYDREYVTVTAASVLDNLGSDVELLDLDSSDCDIAFDDGVFTCRKPAHPVRMVTWYGAAAYCDWLSLQIMANRAYDHTTWECNGGDPYGASGFRLPTEAEWEFACRAGTTTSFCNGEITDTGCDDPLLDLVGWYCGAGVDDPATVGQLAPNGWGLYDMHGNCWEWCNDYFSENYYAFSPAVDPPGPGPDWFRVLRSGGIQNSADACRSANRNGNYETSGYYSWGFRVARTNN